MVWVDPEPLSTNKRLPALQGSPPQMNKTLQRLNSRAPLPPITPGKQGKKLSATDIKGGQQTFAKDENKERGNWSNQVESVLSCLGYVVGFGTILRFPYLCYRHGGAAFLVPYSAMLVLVGTPMVFLEMSLGQYTSTGLLTSWQMAKLFKGVGVGMVWLAAIIAVYYSVVLTWCIFYLFASFTTELPWVHCDHNWNSQFCSLRLEANISDAAACTGRSLIHSPDGVCYDNHSVPVAIYNQSLASEHGISAAHPAQEYLTRYVWGTHMASGMEDLGGLRGEVLLCLILAWICVCGCLVKGVKSSGKVVYVTVLVPYIALIALLARLLTLEGHFHGLEYYLLKADMSVLAHAQVWKDAAIQTFFSLSASWGGLITLASYNRFHNNVLRDSIIISFANCLTSFLIGLVIFSLLGFSASENGKSIDEIVENGHYTGIGMVFIACADAVARMPASPLWAILFFLMLISLGLDTQLSVVETVTTALMDQFPSWRKHRPVVVASTATILFLLGIILCTEGGSYLVFLVEHYVLNWNVLLIALVECICVAWVYGVRRFKEDIGVMLESSGRGYFLWNVCSYWWMATWAVLTPLCLTILIIYWWVDYTPYTEDDYIYPQWAEVLGWLISVSTVLPIIATPVLLLRARAGTRKQELLHMMRASSFWGPALPQHRQLVKHLEPIATDPGSETHPTNTDA